MKKRILIFSLVYYPDFIGGAEVAIKEITDRLGDDFEFDMVTLRAKGESKRQKIGNVNVYRVGFPTLGLTLNKYLLIKTGFWKAVFLHRKKKYDAIWSMMATYNSFAALFFKIFHPQVPFLLTLQEGDPIPYIKQRAKPLWLLFTRIFTKADHIQTISHYLADFAKEMKATCPITVVPNAVCVDHFSREVSQEEKNEIYEKISNNIKRKENDVLLITTSRLVKKNAVGDIIDALVHLPTNYKLIICGIGDEKEMLYEKVASHDFSDRVHFQGRISHEEMPVWLQASHIFIRPSVSEGFGNSFIEAMAAHIPVIGTPVGGIVDFLFDRETGLLCEVSNPKSVAEKVLELHKDEILRKHIIERAFNMVVEKYDWNNIAGQMNQVFVKTLYKKAEKA
jgi:glycosyltransferase involved in cell wall biosynthesis